MSALRVLALQTGFDLRAGGARADFEILGTLARAGHTVRVVMPAVNHQHPLPVGVTARFVPARGFKLPQSLGLAALPFLLDEARRFRPDILRDHSPYTFALAALTTNRLMSVPTVASFLHPESGRHAEWVECQLLQHYAAVTTISRFSLERLVVRNPRLANRVRVIYPGVDQTFRPRSLDCTAWRLAHDLPVGPLFAMVGTLAPRKNHAFLLAVWRAWVDAGRAGMLVLVGDGPERAVLQQRVAQEGLTSRVRFWSWVEHETLIELYNTATAFVFPSQLEGFGLAPAEAMACGTPAIVSVCGSLPEVVTGDVTGFVLPVDRGTEPWVQAMQRLCDEPELRACMGRAAMADVRARFDWDRAGRETAAAYERIVARQTT